MSEIVFETRADFERAAIRYWMTMAVDRMALQKARDFNVGCAERALTPVVKDLFTRFYAFANAELANWQGHVNSSLARDDENGK